MISFMISVPLPTIDWTRLSRQSSQSGRERSQTLRLSKPGGLHPVSASRGGRAGRSELRSPARGSSGRLATPRAAAWPP